STHILVLISAVGYISARDFPSYSSIQVPQTLVLLLQINHELSRPKQASRNPDCRWLRRNSWLHVCGRRADKRSCGRHVDLQGRPLTHRPTSERE
ncbi:hypothetical protein WOLCODRAFT_139713, partial [Wolfiporia cocos MD-104 SS10]